MREDIRRTDPLTGDKFFAKRANQKFASPENRIKFNNNAANELKKKRDFINKPLNKTHRLLILLMQGKKAAIFTFDYLDGYQVDFRLANHFTFFEGNYYPSIFEFTFIIDEVNKAVKIIYNGRL